MKNIAYIITNSGTVNIVVDGVMKNIPPDHMNYRAVIKALKKKDYSNIANLIDLKKAVESKSGGLVTIRDEDVLFKGEKVHNVVTKKIMDLNYENLPFDFLLKFLENTLLNPNSKAIAELYTFLEANSLPITDGGCFLAYKRVTKDYLDLHTETFDNSVGSVVKMNRKDCDLDRNNACSSGLHFCSLSYLDRFGTDDAYRTVIVKINPKDVTSFPSDHTGKGRCCKYTVVAEHKEQSKKDILSKRSVVTKSGSKTRLRDSTGKFIKWVDFRPRNKQGHFIKKSAYRPRDSKGHFIKAT